MARQRSFAPRGVFPPLFLAFLVLAASSASSLLPATRQARVVLTTGAVTIDGRVADVGQSLGRVVLIETGPGARCDIVFGGGNALSLGPLTRARIDFASPAINLRLERGAVSSVLKKLGKLLDRPAFDLSTPQALAAVRGTSFFVTCGGDETYVCACNGTVHFEDASGGNAVDITAAHHEGREFKAEAKGYSVSPAGLLDHSDGSMESVARDIGYSIDWSKPDD